MFFELPYLWHTPWYAGPDFRHLMPVSTSLGVVYFLVTDALCCPPTALEIPVDVITGIVSIPIFILSCERRCAGETGCGAPALPRIDHLCEQPYTHISGVERQLVLLAATLTQCPAFLVLDEPTAHRERGNAHRFLDLVLRLYAQGIGILMTTHFPDHALYLRAQTLVLKDKIRWKHGAVEDVIDEASMTELCELPVHIGSIDTRTVCVGGDVA